MTATIDAVMSKYTCHVGVIHRCTGVMDSFCGIPSHFVVF